MGTARRLQATVAILAVVMLFASVLAIVQRSDFLESVAEAPTRDVVNPSDTLTAAESERLDQLARVGDGITLDGATASIDGRFMLAGPAFETDTGATFSVVTTSWMGGEIADAAEPVLDGDRVVYQHADITEWWVRNGRGYEQGWTVDAAPADGSTELVLDVVFAGAALTQLSPTTVEMILGDGSRAWYRNLHAFDADSTPLPAYLSVQGSQVTISVDADGAVYPVTIDPIIDADQEISAPASTANDFFGEVVATDADLMVVSSRGSDLDTADDQGTVEVFRWNGTDWDVEAVLQNPVAADTDFGWDVDINSTAGMVVVGAPEDSVNGDGSGAVHIFVEGPPGTWGFKQSIYQCDTFVLGSTPCGDTAPGGFVGAAFGTAVAVADDQSIAVGAPGFVSSTGRAYVYEPIGGGGEWLTNDGRALPGQFAGDRLGRSIDISANGQFVVIGAPTRTVGGFTGSGVVYLYEETGAGTWALADTDSGPGGQVGQEYGASVAIADIAGGTQTHLVVAGRPHRTRFDDAGTGFGGVRVMSFDAAAANLTTVGLGDISAPGADGGMGFSVATDGANVIVGEPFNAGFQAPERGLVRVFTYAPGTDSMDGGGGASAVQQNLPVDFAPPIAVNVDRYGYSVAVGPQTGVTGPYVTGIPQWQSDTPRPSPRSGRVATASAAVTFTPSPVGENTVLTETTSATSAAFDQVGGATAISGNRMAVLASGDEFGEQPQAGAVHFYERATELDPWSLDTIVPVPAANPNGGQDVVVDVPYGSLDMEGNFLVVGMADDGRLSQFEDGAVAVYEHNGTTWVLRDEFDASVANTSIDEFGGFGTDVAISSDGEYLAVGFPGADSAPAGASCTLPDCGTVVVMEWDALAGTYNFVIETGTPDGETNAQTGISVDLDLIPGSTDYRVISGRLNGVAAVDSWTFDPADAAGTLAFEASISTLIDDGESVALDGNRLVAAQSSTVSDIAIVADFEDDRWAPRTLTTAELAPTGVAVPNQFVDVVGDYAVVGRADNAGGEVGVFFNDPAFGWGVADALSGWIDGPFDRVQPVGRASGDGVGFSVAAGATVGGGIQVVTGAPNDPTSGTDAGAVYAFDVTYTGTAKPANKITVDTFNDESGAAFGAHIAARNGTDPGGAIVSAPLTDQMYYLREDAGVWTIAQTFDLGSGITDLDFVGKTDAAQPTLNGRAAVVLESGQVRFYDETCVTVNFGGVVSTTCSLSFSGVTFPAAAGQAESVAIAINGGLNNDVAYVAEPANGLIHPILLTFGVAGGTLNAPADVDGFGSSLAVDGGFLYVGADSFDAGVTNPGGVLVFDTATLTEQTRFNGPEAATGAGFGASLAVDGTTLVVGATGDNSADGQAYVYEYNSGTSTANLVGTLTPSGGSGLSTWGFSSAIDGDTIVIGGTGYEEGGIPFRDGSAQVFSFDGLGWVETNRLDHSDDASADQAGHAVAIVGTDVLVGVRLDDNPQGQDAGAVYTYTATAASPAPANKIVAEVVASVANDTFGRHIDIDGTTALIAEQNGGGYEFWELVGADWQFRSRFEVPGGSHRAVDVDGDRAVVLDRIGNNIILLEQSCVGGLLACPFSEVETRSVGGTGEPASVVLDGDDIFVGLSNSTNEDPLKHELWGGGNVAVPNLVGSLNGDEAGSSLAKDGDLIFVGAPGWDNTPADNAGRVYVYDSVAQSWTITIEADQPGDKFGEDLAAEGGVLFVGYQNGQGPVNGGPGTALTGIVEVYTDIQTPNPSFMEVIAGSESESGDGFGKNVDIDGGVVVVGATNNVWDAQPYGQAYAFQLSGGSYVESDIFRAEDPESGSGFGEDVAISGSNVLVGAFAEDNANGVDAGAAYSFTVGPVPVVDNPNITFNLGLGQGSPTSISVAPAGVSVTDFNGALIEQEAEDDTTLAASSLNDTPISALPISALPISALPISALATEPGSPLNVLPILQVDLDIDGGWPALFATSNSALAALPINDVTLGDVFNDTAASGQLASTPISALDVNGTPISALPISALLLGALELDELSTSVDWCDILVDFVDAANDCTIAADEEAVGNLTLIEASLSGVPISALPISALPISALPISATGVDALPISALPISALDLEASPISAVPISALPISATPISALPISATPISALDPVSIPISATSVSGLPISALPISALELNGTPISATPISALPISALELSNIPISATPISATPISALPISAVPISAVFLADTALSDIPISAVGTGDDWCTLLEDLGAGYDCSFEVPGTSFLDETTIVDLGVRGVPISALPISAVPISAVPISATPISALPISALPISAVTLGSLPISATPISATPISALGPNLASTPISAVDLNGTPISALPISALLVGGTPISATPISATPISALPISATPISATPISAVVLGGTPISATPISALDLAASPISATPISALPISALGIDCTLVDCDVDSLYDAFLAGAIDPATTLGQLQASLTGFSMADIAPHFNGFTEQDVIDAIAASGQTLGDLLSFDGIELADLPLSDPNVATLVLGDFLSAWSDVRLSDLVGALLDPATGQPFPDADVEAAIQTILADAAAAAGVAEFTLADLDVIGDMTIADLLTGDLTGFNADSLGSILNLVHLNDATGQLNDATGLPGETFGTIDPALLGDLTLLDLLGLTEIENLTLGELFDAANAADALYGFSVSDLLLALLGLDAIPFAGFDFTEVESGQLPETVLDAVTFEATFELAATAAFNRSVDLAVELPSTASYLIGSVAAEDVDTGAAIDIGEPTVDGNILRWTILGVEPDQEISVTFDVRPTVTIGSTALSGSASLVGTDITAASFTSVDVVEGIEPNDYPTTTPLAEDTVYLTYISSETDNDVFSITVGENDEIAVQLSSLTADLDVAIYGEVANTTTASALTSTSDAAPLDPITDPDQTGADTEPLDDFRRLDEEDPSLVFLDVSNAPGTETELLVTDPLPAGTYYIQVFGANGATNVEPAALQIDVIGGEPRPICAANGPVTGALGTAPSLAGSTANTLFLVNEQRMRDAYGQAGLDEVTTALDDLVDYLTNTNPGLGIDPIVVPVDGIGPVQSAYQAWDTDANCDPESANAVVEAIIANAIDPLRNTLDHVVVVGGDPIIPMARLLDSTEIANEYDFRHEFIGDNLIGGNADQINALSASFWDRRFLSDEPYGASDARSLGNRFLYVSDIALGRMVETPSEIAAQLDHFVNFNGSLDANTASVLGYDFLVDSSEQIAADLVAAGLTVDDELADGLDAGGAKWDRLDAADKLVGPGGAADLVSLNGHFDHYRALPADGDQVPGFTNNFEADDVLQEILATPGLLEGSIIFSMGCHGGLSVSDLQIADGPDNTNGDWAQTFATDQAIFIGNTGFGYGDTEAVAYTEQLMAKFAELVVRPNLVNGLQTTVGEALMFAKNDYVADLSTFSVYDEKALMESTFYGLPFYRVGATPVPAPPAPDNVTSPDATGVETLGVNADATNDPNVEDRGQFFSNPDENGDPQTIVAPGRPIQPSLSTDVSVVDPADSTELGQIAHGAVILGMDSQYQPNINPVVAAVVFNESDDSPEPELGDVVFPAKPVTINTSTTPSGERQSLVLATGQFDSDGLVQRLDDNINAVVYYADPSETDFEPPTIGVVESNFDPVTDLLTITLSAADTDNPVVRVYVLAAADPGAGSVTWTGLDLVQTPGTDEWSGSLSLVGDEVEFLIQAVDAAGNVGFATNKARNFVDDGSEDPEPPAPDLNVVVPNPGPEGWYTGPVTVGVNSGDLDTTFEITPGTAATPTVGGQFTVDGQGVFTWTVTASDGQTTSGVIRIDSTAPTAELAPPADGATFEVSQVPAVGFACTDPSLVSCTATVTPAGGAATPLANGDALPDAVGSYTVSVTATDVFGNTASASAGYTVIADVLDPITVTVSPANLDIGSGLYTGDVEITVVSEGDVEYTLDGGAPIVIPAPGGTFTITDEGQTDWVVTRPADGATENGSVEIDTTAPVVTITQPVDAEVYTPGSVPLLDFDCTDANLAAVDPCVATIDGVPIADGDALPDAVGGPYVVEVTGTDALGQQTVESVSYTVTGLTVIVSPDNLDLLSGLYTGPVEVTVDGGGFPTEYTLNGAAPVAIPAGGGAFTITLEGVTNWTVTRLVDGAVESGSVEIDTTAPTASLIAPTDGSTFTPGTVPALDFDCSDVNLVSCAATVDGTPTGLGAALPDAVGSYDIVVTGTDAVGLTATANGTYTVEIPAGDPIIVTDIEIDGVAEPGEPVDIWGSFIGGVAPYSISVDWGDGGTCADGTCAIEAPTVDEDGMFDASYVYPVGGAYTVTVTLTDAAGVTATETLVSATCTITGTSGRDVLRGTSGDDVICGFAGNDRLYGRGGNDIIFGGSGRDRLYGQNGNDILFGGRDNDILYGSFGEDELSGGRGVDTLIAGDGNDVLKGRQDNDWMYGQDGNDTLIGNRGNDRMFGGTGDDTMDGRRGNDRMYGQAGNDMMDGGNGNDLMYGGNGNDVMNGQNGDDDIFGGRGNDTIDGGPDGDLCRGNNGNDTLIGCEF